MRTLPRASVPGFPSVARKVASARTTFAQTMHLANACHFNSFSISLQQTSRCKDMSYRALQESILFDPIKNNVANCRNQAITRFDRQELGEIEREMLKHASRASRNRAR